MNKFRVENIGRIARDKILHFTFNGKKYVGFQGDTLASALLANGIHLIARSIKYHRPRGFIGSGVEDPNGLVKIGSGSKALPNHFATQIELYEGLEAESVNCWPSVNFDFGALQGKLSRFMVPGFYYKTFMWPSWLWPIYEKLLRNRAGYGVVPSLPDVDRYEKRNIHCEFLIIGGGPAGITAALAAGRSGLRVILVDEQNELGGTLLNDRVQIDSKYAHTWLNESINELNKMPEVKILSRSTAFGNYEHQYIGVLERIPEHHLKNSINLPRERIWKIRAAKTFIATGAIERSLVFVGNDVPGVMLSSAVESFIFRYGVSLGENVAFVTNNDSIYNLCEDLNKLGINVPAIIDFRSNINEALIEKVTKIGIDVYPGWQIEKVIGNKRINQIEISELENVDKEASKKHKIKKINCDILAMSGGWDTNLHLYSQIGNKINYDANLKCFVPYEEFKNQHMIGSCSGLTGTQDCLNQGFQTVLESLKDFGIDISSKKFKVQIDPYLYDQSTISNMIESVLKKSSMKRKQFVDFQLDVTSRDIDVSLDEGFESIQHIKRYTKANTGTDQGKISGTNLSILIAQKTGKEISEVGPTTFRPPYTPVTFGAIAGRSLLDQFDPVRQTSIHDWHVSAGAKFENVGQWKRPWFYPKDNETMDDAVGRECLAVRNSLGICDASTLGKIEINGPDSAEFLNRVYVNNWTKLQIGRCRYGLMLGDDGNVMDDGVTARIGETKYLMHTTTTGASAVMDWLERWLQTEWPELKVYLTSVTDQWSTISINGPNSRKVLSKLCSDIDLSNESFPFMSFKSGIVSGVKARIFRVSFAGELSYEINVHSEFATALWESIMDAGKEFGITPYGTEAMHVLRAEKGYVIVGQDTDGSVTPIDLGYGKMLSKTKDFLGKRSLDRKEMVRNNRKQFVGLIPVMSSEKIPEGAQIVESLSNSSIMIGHVTSSYFSPTLDKNIALSLIESGRTRKGEYVYAIDTKCGSVKVQIVSPVFYDFEGYRQNV